MLGPLGHGTDVAAGSLLVVGGGIGAPHAGLRQICSQSGKRGPRGPGVPGRGTQNAYRRLRRVLPLPERHQRRRLHRAQRLCHRTGGGVPGEPGVRRLLQPAVPVAWRLRSRQCLPAGPSPCSGRWRRSAPGTVHPARSPWRRGWAAAWEHILVCACKTSDGHRKHVCKDGPVFRAEEVDWND
ncbi:MAG: hypothetical protein ACLSAF_01790 [Intestinimonas sp.]